MSLEQAVQANTAAIRDLIKVLLEESDGGPVPFSDPARQVLGTPVVPEIVKPVAEVVPEIVKPVAEVVPEIVKPVETTKEMVNAQLKAAMQAKGGPALRVLFAEFGVSNFKDITESQYAPMHAAATKLLKG